MSTIPKLELRGPSAWQSRVQSGVCIKMYVRNRQMRKEARNSRIPKPLFPLQFCLHNKNRIALQLEPCNVDCYLQRKAYPLNVGVILLVTISNCVFVALKQATC